MLPRGSRQCRATRAADAKAAETAVQKTTQAAGRALRSILAAAQSLLAAMRLAAAPWYLMVLVICLIGLLIASPFGIFFSGEDSGTGYTMPEAVSVLNSEFAARIEQIKAENPHDESGYGQRRQRRHDLQLAGCAGCLCCADTTDNASPDEVATLTEEKMEILREIFWDMNAISYWLETISGAKMKRYRHPAYHRHGKGRTCRWRMSTDSPQNSGRLLEELMQPEYQELFAALTGSYQDIELSPDEVAKIMENLPADLSEASQSK